MVRPAALVSLLATLAAPGHLAADAREPHLALRTGLKCSQCHVNRTGGGLRTEFGSVYGQTELPMSNANWQFLNRRVAEWLAVGSDMRFAATASVSEAVPRTTLGVQKANVMAEARLIRRQLALYIDQTVGPDRATARELFGLIENLPANGYAKVGKMVLPYGLRIQDDRAFIRLVTGFSFETPDQGIEVGIEPGPLSVALAVTTGARGGPTQDDGKQVVGSATVIQRQFRVGISGSRNDQGPMRRDTYGAFGGLRLGPLVLLGEVDRLVSTGVDGTTNREMVAFGEGDVLLRQGINAKVTYGYHDPDTNMPEDERTRLRFGVELFPMPFLQTSVFYTVLDDVPLAPAQEDRVSLEVHFYF